MSINEDCNCPQCNGDDILLCRPCGTFLVYAGRILLGKSELELETIDQEGFYREGSFEPVFETYLPFQDLFRHYQNLKLEQHLRLPAFKHMPELETCEREIQKLGLRLVAPNGEDVPTQRFELVDCDVEDGRELNVFITDETVYARYFPPNAKNA
jgi:hypothetical protein